MRRGVIIIGVKLLSNRGKLGTWFPHHNHCLTHKIQLQALAQVMTKFALRLLLLTFQAILVSLSITQPTKSTFIASLTDATTFSHHGNWVSRSQAQRLLSSSGWHGFNDDSTSNSGRNININVLSNIPFGEIIRAYRGIPEPDRGGRERKSPMGRGGRRLSGLF